MHARSSNAFGHAENADQSRKTNERTRTEESQLGPLPHSLPSASNKNEAKIDGFCSGRCFSEIGKTVEGREREKEEEGAKLQKKNRGRVGSPSVGWKIDWVEVGKKCGGDEKNAICGFHQRRLLFWFLLNSLKNWSILQISTS